MKFAILSVIAVVYLLVSILDAEVARGKIFEQVNFCKRNDPQIQKCYCENFNRLIPLIKNGIPEVNIMPIDPVHVENIRMEWPQTRAVQFQGELNNITMHGLSLGRAVQCNAYMTENGIQLAFELVFPEIEMKARYDGSGKYLIFALHGNGDFWGKYSGMNVKSIWNTTHYIKQGKDHLKFTAKITHLDIEKIQFYFANLLGSSTEINDKINEMLNANVDLLYDEVKPVILQTVEKLSLKIVNDLYYMLSFDVLFPKN